MKWSLVFGGVIMFCVMCILTLVLIQRMPNNVVRFAPPKRNIIRMNAEIIDNGTAFTNQENTSRLGLLSQKNSSATTVSSTGSTLLKSTRLNVSEGLPLLTIFTTLKNVPDRFEIHSNTLKNWAMFQPYIIPLLYTSETDPKLVELARKLGWEVIPVPKTNPFGTPYLKPMYRQAKNKYSSVFYGFANADLLFEYGLVDTLKAVTSCLHQLKETMIVGRRTNFKVSGRTVFKPDKVKEISHNEGKLFRFDAEDYFFMAHAEFPWYKVPDIIVGRPAYDNFLVATAWRNHVSVVDASATLLALHQSGKDGDFSGHAKSKDVSHNYKVIGKFDYGKGLTKNAQFETIYGKTGEIELWHRVVKQDPKRYKIAPTVLETESKHLSSDSSRIDKAVENTVKSSNSASQNNFTLLGILKSLENSNKLMNNTAISHTSLPK